MRQRRRAICADIMFKYPLWGKFGDYLLMSRIQLDFLQAELLLQNTRRV
jgi:hypothetical protein